MPANADWVRGLRFAIITLLGGKCEHCGIADTRVLDIDHIDGGGVRHRRNFQSHRYYVDILRTIAHGGRQKFRLLCANHNRLAHTCRRKRR